MIEDRQDQEDYDEGIKKVMCNVGKKKIHLFTYLNKMTNETGKKSHNYIHKTSPENKTSQDNEKYVKEKQFGHCGTRQNGEKKKNDKE